MLMELGYVAAASDTQISRSIAGYPVNGIMIFFSREDFTAISYLTVRNTQGVLVERIPMDYLHQLSDYNGGNTIQGAATVGMLYVDMGLVNLGMNDEMSITIDVGTVANATNVGIAVIIDDLPSHDELAYHYALHSDSSFTADSAAALYVFKTAANVEGGLVNVKTGNDTRSTTVRAANWYANLMGKCELDNTTFGVVFENTYGQGITVNHATTGLTCVVKRVVQPDEIRRVKSTRDLANAVATKVRYIDPASKRAALSQ